MQKFLKTGLWATFILMSASLMARADDTPPRVVIETTLGSIVVEVYPDKAPVSAASFLKYVDEGLYENAGFYRVVRHDNDNGNPKITVIQGGVLGDIVPDGGAHETTEQTGLTHVDGALSLARAAVGTGSAAAFFICVGDQPALDFGATRNPDKQGFAVFGQVIEGMDVVRRINNIRETAATENAYLKGQILTEPVRFNTTRQP